jgi:thioester reductase-like protein
MHWAISGGTGFLGVHMLRELLRGSGTFTLLTRPASDPFPRIQKALALAATDGQVRTDEQLRQRLAVVPVDFGKPNLGLPVQQFNALADGVDAVLHCAGNTKLDGDVAALRRANVDGTARILEFAQAGSRKPDLFHVSTAFVAGDRRSGIVYEQEIGGDAGFENNYESSKFEAESLVRDWALRTGRRVVVLRPSILVSDRPPNPDFPLHPLAYLSKSADAAMRLLAMSGRPVNFTLRLRVTGDPNGHLNFMPVGEAAEAIVGLLRLAPDGLSTYHVVHHHDVAVQTLLDVFSAVSSIRFSLVDGPVENPSVLERRLRWGKGFLPYLQHSRTFDTTGAAALLGQPSGQTVVDVNYLLAGVGRHNQSFAERAAQETGKSPLPGQAVEHVVPHFGPVVHNVGPVSPVRGLTFIVTVGRSGSTALSRILSGHRDVLSLNEFYLSVRTSLSADQPLSSAQFWRVLAEPHPILDAMVRGGAGMPEFVYPRLAGTRFNANTTGIPAISMMTLPHLSPDPDAVFDALAAEVTRWPRQTAHMHYERLFGWLAAHFGGSVVVERSGMSLCSVPWLRKMFPDARFVHLFRSGPDTAVSMSEHTGFRLMVLIDDALGLLDLDPEQSQNPGLRLDPSAIPSELAPLVGVRCDLDYLMSQDLPVGRFARMWSESIAIGLAALADLPAARYLPMSYSDLVADPKSCLTRLATFLDVEADPKWLDFGASVIDPSFVGISNRLSGTDLQAVVEGCAAGEALLRDHLIALKRGVAGGGTSTTKSCSACV